MEAADLSRQFNEDSGNSRKSQVPLQHLKSSHMKLSQDGNESQNGTSSRSSRSEEKRPKLALSEVNGYGRNIISLYQACGAHGVTFCVLIKQEVSG
jgi:hypothetical protein